ncbi:uncharacterized protein LOC134537173 [Bacillus rossius redtenbacheri]|uniref:uncharacterized protein LOC134537173 n=1 Tax=Bacillus rossius redtenbacheri TaxID=93214 RepID=UPI002FDD61F0
MCRVPTGGRRTMALGVGRCLRRAWVLLGVVAAAAGLQCYESACLRRDLADCLEDGRAVLRDCEVATFVSLLRAIRAPLLDKSIEYSMTCGKLGWEGDDLAHRAAVLRMCLPDVQDLCERLQNFTVRRWTHVYRRRPLVEYGCHFCDTDGCNSATAGRALLALAPLAAAGLLLALR